MKAMILREFNKPFWGEDVPLPTIGNEDLLIKVKGCGVCYTDVKIASGLFPEISLPRILGHEVAGEVVSLGRNVKNFKEGDRVCLYFYLFCGQCDNCLDKKENLCLNLRGRIGFDFDGGYAEYVKAPATHAFKIPRDLSFEEAAILTDAVATPLHALREQAQLRAGESLAIIGVGGLGMQAVQIGKHLGAKVIAVDLEERRLKMAKDLGAEEAFHGAKGDLTEAILAHTRGKGVDTVLDLVGKDETIHSSIKFLKKGGKIILVGYSFDRPFSIFPAVIMRNEFTIVGSRACRPKELEDVIQLVAEKKIKPMVSERIPLERANEVHDRLKKNEILGRVVLQP
jgi:2-desacetyl-2-hydroxyethyl bacteriochlorophyllide A dehydrogenase